MRLIPNSALFITKGWSHDDSSPSLLALPALHALHHFLGAEVGDDVVQVARVAHFDIHQDFKEIGGAMGDFEIADIAEFLRNHLRNRG
jgi:hypothetical protein